MQHINTEILYDQTQQGEQGDPLGDVEEIQI